MSRSRVRTTTYFSACRRVLSSRAISRVTSFSQMPWDARAPESLPPWPGSSTIFLTPRDAVTGASARGPENAPDEGDDASQGIRSGRLPESALKAKNPNIGRPTRSAAWTAGRRRRTPGRSARGGSP